MTRADFDSTGVDSKRLRVERSSSSRRLSSRSFSSWAIPDVNLYHNGAEYFAKDWFSAVPIEMKALAELISWARLTSIRAPSQNGNAESGSREVDTLTR